MSGHAKDDAGDGSGTGAKCDILKFCLSSLKSLKIFLYFYLFSVCSISCRMSYWI
ncbi:hypothetical protein CPB83DRAFT_861349 [Crepidotus variabilis]|uniref:Uncharacterized protein n=1 Tax=Crepidotus variabilis TaxID=179855 RepID=A0A9P6E844_9AGAR|nr:hypothetical protein CPB83DRAFT_861349 [Crepidotus variabilis]